MTNPYKVWAIKYDGKCMHIEYATRLPRKLKKIAKTVFGVLKERHSDFVLVSPGFGELTEKWVSSSKDSANAKSVS
jgi:hypothetical protein